MRQATIAECFSHIGRGKSPQYVEHDGIKVINQACIYWDGIDYKKIKRHDPNKAFHKALVKNQDLLMNSTGTGTLGRAAVHQATDDDEYIADSHVTIMRPHKDVNPFYFAYYFSYPPIQERLYRECVSGSTNQIELSKDKLLSFQVYLPNFATQNSLVQILDKVQTLISLRKQQIAKLDELVKARFVEMFGDPVLNPMQWPVNELSEYIEFLTSGSRGWSQFFTDDGELFITIKNVKNCRITLDDVQHVTPPDNAEAKRTKVQEGDLLISITADLGRTGVVTKEIADHGAYINQHLTCIRLNNAILHPLYVAYFMESEAGKEQFQAKNQSAVKAGLNFNSINSLRLIVPPLNLQHQFAAFVAQTDQQKLTIQASLAKLETLKKALMQKYFG